MDNRFNKVFPSFDSLNIEISPSSYLIDVFPNCFPFHSYFKYNDYNLIDHANQLNNITICQVRFTPGWKSTEWTKR